MKTNIFDNLPPTIRQAMARFNRVILLGLAVIVSSAPIMLINQTATAFPQVTSRSVLISSPHTSQTGVVYTFGFTPATTTTLQSATFIACKTALGACVHPTGINLSGGTVTDDGNFQGATAFTKDTTTVLPGCTNVAVLCVTRTDATNQTATPRAIIDTGVTNQDNLNCAGNPNCTFFIRIMTFSDNAYTTETDYGTVAASTTQRFTVNAAIQEALDFCIGATTIDDMNTSNPPPCSSVSGTSLDLGVLSPTIVSVSPVDAATDLGDTNNGIAELSTNAFHGATVSYASVQDVAGVHQEGTLKVQGAVCNIAQVNTDQCLNAVGTTHAFVVPGAENFGMTIAGVNCNTSPRAYPCDYAFGSNNLVPDAAYDGSHGVNTYPNLAGTNIYDADTNQVAGTTVSKYAWDDSGTYRQIASSATVVDHEAMILKFAATPNAVSPTGAYSTSADFVATPTF